MEKLQQRNNALYSLEFIKLSVLLADLVTELQRERGLSYGFVGSDGKLFSHELQAQRQLTDTQADNFKVSIRPYIDDSNNFELANELHRIEDELQQLSEVRLSVDAIESQSIHLEFYSRFNPKAIYFIEKFRTITHSASVASLWNTYTTLLMLQESAGLERAWVNKIFTSNDISAVTLKKASSYVAIQDLLFRDFNIFASPEQQALLKENMDHYEVEQVMAVRANITNRFDRSIRLNKIQSLMGYGGVIHNFKNYLLRGQLNYAQQFDEAFVATSQQIKSYRELSHITEEHRSHLDKIQNTLDLYKLAMNKLLKSKHKNLSISLSDNTVKIDDKPALQAIDNLNADSDFFDAEKWWKNSTFRINNIKEIGEHAKLETLIGATKIFKNSSKVLLFYQLFTSAVILFAVYIGFLVWRRLSIKIKRIASDMQNMAKNSDTHALLPLSGNDEITSMVKAFNRLATQRQQASDELNDHKINLEILVGERTQELEKATRKAEHAMEVKSAFLANMSHEIRTPINGVIVASELLQETQLTKEQHSLLNAVNRSSKILSSVINQVLDISKIESGEMEVSIESCSIEQVITDCITIIDLNAKKKGLQIDFHINDDVPIYLMLDSNYLSQVLLNLLSNSVKFTEQGSVSVTASLDKAHEKQQLKISVRDTGIGIPNERIDAIFGEFIQADYSTTRLFGGTGLGLSIARDLVELMDGEIHVNSRYSEGAEFIVSLPAVQAEGPSNLTKSTQDTEEIEFNFENIKVLLVEDNAVNQMVARCLLERQGCLVDLASDGQEALEAYRQGHFDLILMDCQMPVMDGYEASQAIRLEDLEKNSHIPIIAMTANTMEGDRERCLEAGMDEYITKPINRELLFSIMTVLLAT